MYQALYRKWRPKTFDEISGQQHITKILRMQCEENRVSHAYLFCGTRGTGKTSTAKILAKAINCDNPVNGNPCNCCYACTSIDSGTATDVLEIDAASNNGVDDIRELRDEVVYPPSVLKKRVYIIDEVHMLSSGAFNALLKTLEEPPEYIAFILATTELNKLPATIISRCIRFDFNRLSEEIIADRLRYVAEQENIPLGEGAAELLSRLADGALRDGLSILEACTSGIGEGHAVTAQSVRDRLGIADADQIVAYYSAVATGNVPDALAVLEEIHCSSKDISVFLEDIAAMARDMLVIQQLKSASQNNLTFRFAKEASALLEQFSSAFTPETLFYFCSVLEDTQSRITRYSTDKKVMLEFATIRMCDPSLSENPKALLTRISRLERQLANGAVTISVPSKAETKQPTAVKKDMAVPKQSCGQAFTQYAELAEEMQAYPDIYPYVQKIKASIDGDKFLILADSFTNSMLQLGNNASLLAEAVKVVTGVPYSLEFKDLQKSMDNDPLDEL